MYLGKESRENSNELWVLRLRLTPFSLVVVSVIDMRLLLSVERSMTYGRMSNNRRPADCDRIRRLLLAVR